MFHNSNLKLQYVDEWILHGHQYRKMLETKLVFVRMIDFLTHLLSRKQPDRNKFFQNLVAIFSCMPKFYIGELGDLVEFGFVAEIGDHENIVAVFIG